MFHLERVILKLNRVDLWSGAHPDQMPNHVATALTYFQTSKNATAERQRDRLGSNCNKTRKQQIVLVELSRQNKKKTPGNVAFT